jgi:aromatic ring-opening dioxygenase catalytic subunit (LigB family)
MYEVDHPAYRKLGEIGREITTKVKPKAVVVFSAHWQAGRNTIQVNTAEKTDLIYEYVDIKILAQNLQIRTNGS